MTAAAAAVEPAAARRRMTAVRFVRAARGRRLNAVLVQRWRLVIVVTPVIAIAVVPAIAVPIRRAPIEVVRICGRDVRVWRIVVVSARRIIGVACYADSAARAEQRDRDERGSDEELA